MLCLSKINAACVSIAQISQVTQLDAIIGIGKLHANFAVAAYPTFHKPKLALFYTIWQMLGE